MALHWLPNYILLVAFLAALESVSGEKIQVHIVPHSHLDPGWLKTVDQYYYGAHNEIQHGGVQYILHTIIQELQSNPNRTFIWVEMAFFMRWWNEQSDVTKATVRKLVTETHQLEFINGGWTMNDEAVTDHTSIIDQMTVGLRFVEENFGPSARPQIAWHIDTFGHSSEMATIHALLGMDGFFFFRVDWADRQNRQEHKTMEMVWRGSQSLGKSTEIFTGVLYNGYGPPKGFCFDIQCSNVIPIQDDPNLEEYNVEERVNGFVNAVLTRNSCYETGHVMLTMGSDFQYESAVENYLNIDKLISYVNAKSDQMEVFYSTPSRYVDAINKLNKTWTLKTDDFFPYSDNSYSYWTGYYTSRPGLKGYAREMNSLLQSCKQFEVQFEGLGLWKHTNFSFTNLKLAVALNQHHDAITGTERQTVADDYAKRLHIGQTQCQGLMNDGLRLYLSSFKNNTPPVFVFCEYLNISLCPPTETNNFAVMVHNPIGRATTEMLNFPVYGTDFEVFDSAGHPVASQVIPVSSATKSVRRYRGNASHSLFWSANLPGLGGTMFFIQPATRGGASYRSELSKVFLPPKLEDISIENEALKLTFGALSGRLKSIVNKHSNITVAVDQNLMWWRANSNSSVQASGAYVFSPHGTLPHDISPFSIANTSVVNGSLVQEVRQQWSSWAYQTVKLYKDLPVAIFEYTIGPIPYEDHVGKEVVSRFTTDLKSNSTWYTDSNGREMQKRIRNYRPTWKWIDTEPVAGNYYPVPSRIYLRDEDRGVQFTVLADRAQGGSSLKDGQLELMVHRRLFDDDGKGLKEALNEPGQFGDGLIVRGSHYVILDNFSSSTLYQRLIGEKLLLRTQSFITPYSGSPSEWMTQFPTQYSVLVRDLPTNIHLLTLERLDHSHHLLRLEHQFQITEQPYNNTATVQLADLFTTMKVVDVVELGLGANAALSDIHRLHWNTDSAGTKGKYRPEVTKIKPPFIVELRPMEIRTFNITVEYTV